MIDEKKIEEAANGYSKILREHQTLSFAYRDFKEGAHWAINEFLKGLWHDASEKPQDFNEWIIIKYDKYSYVAARQVKKEDHWDNVVKHVPSFHWCYLSDILPKEGGEE